MTSPAATRDRAVHARPPRRDPGWVVLLALMVCGVVASLLTAGSTGDPAPAPVAAVSGAPSDEPSADGAVVTSAHPLSRPTASPVVAKGNGRIVQVPTRGKDSQRTGRVVRWSVETEQGLGIDLEELSETVGATLRDPRGWEREVGVRFVRVPAWQAKRGAAVDIRVTLASPQTTDKLCAPMVTGGDVSCWNKGRAVLNARRWTRGAGAYEGRLSDYRTYLINHEVGHGLGYGHEPCHRKGRRASVMLQQTLGLSGCTAWPYPKGDGSRGR